MEVEAEIEQLKKVVQTLAASHAQLAASNTATATALKATTEALSQLQTAHQASARITVNLAQRAYGGMTHLIGLLVMYMTDAGVLTPARLAKSIEETLAIFPEGYDRSYLQGLAQSMRDFDPTSPKPVFQVIEGGRSHTPQGND